MGKTTLYREFGYKTRGPRFSAAGGNTKWACLNLLRIALTILKKQVNDVNDNERLSTSGLFGAAADNRSLMLASLRRFEIAIEIHKYASYKNQINILKCNLVCSTNMTLG